MGNSYGTIFRISTFGESHGAAIGVIIDGCPAGLDIDETFIQVELTRRKPGQSKITTQRKEDDTFKILSGVFDGVSVVLRTTIMQLATPDGMRGRVSAINGIFIGSSNELGAFESGVAARLLGLVPSVVFGGLMTLGVVAVVAKYNPTLKQLELSQLK